MKRLTSDGLDAGFFMKPTIITNVTNQMRVAREEIFGPVLVVIPFSDEDEVVAMANDSEYGLGGAVWTQDINRALRVAKAVRTGRMWVNTYHELPAHAPFGGYKNSGLGRETHKMMLEATAQLTYDSKEELYKENVVSAFDLSTAKNSLLAAKAQLAQAKAQEVSARNNLSYTVVKSPADGVVGATTPMIWRRSWPGRQPTAPMCGLNAPAPARP